MTLLGDLPAVAVSVGSLRVAVSDHRARSVSRLCSSDFPRSGPMAEAWALERDRHCHREASIIRQIVVQSWGILLTVRADFEQIRRLGLSPKGIDTVGASNARQKFCL